jgi:hypothetical protein
LEPSSQSDFTHLRHNIIGRFGGLERDHDVVLTGNVKFLTKINLVYLSVNIGRILESEIIPSTMLLSDEPHSIREPKSLDLNDRISTFAFISLIDEVSLIPDPVLAVPEVGVRVRNRISPNIFSVIFLVSLLDQN